MIETTIKDATEAARALKEANAAFAKAEHCAALAAKELSHCTIMLAYAQSALDLATKISKEAHDAARRAADARAKAEVVHRLNGRQAMLTGGEVVH